MTAAAAALARVAVVAHAARETLGTEGTVASGRMSLTFAIEMLRRHFGADVFNHTGVVARNHLLQPDIGDRLYFLHP